MIITASSPTDIVLWLILSECHTFSTINNTFLRPLKIYSLYISELCNYFCFYCWANYTRIPVRYSFTANSGCLINLAIVFYYSIPLSSTGSHSYSPFSKSLLTLSVEQLFKLIFRLIGHLMKVILAIFPFKRWLSFLSRFLVQ